MLHEHHQRLYDTHHTQVEIVSSESRRQNMPVAYDPRSLHAITPPRWPEVSDEAGSVHGGDPRWARRQFSTLWAPMPHAYNLHGDDSVAPAFLAQHVVGKGNSHSRDENDLSRSVLRLPLPIVEESDVELRCGFISRF